MFENQQLSNADAVPSFLAHRRLALHAARARTLHQALDLGDGDAVVVAQNRVLQAGCRHSELQRGLFVRVGVQAVNQAAAEGVAAAHAVKSRLPPIEALLSRGGGYYLFWLILMDNFIFCRYNLPDDHSQILWPASRHNRWSIQKI